MYNRRRKQNLDRVALVAKRLGDLRDEVVFLGGSIASAMVNLSQVPMMTFPYLTRYEGAGALGRRFW